MTDDDEQDSPPPPPPDLRLVDGDGDDQMDDAMPAAVVWKLAFAEIAPDAIDVAEAEDIASWVRDVYLKHAANDPAFARNRARVGAFVETCARHRCVYLWRKRRRHEQKEPLLAIELSLRTDTADPLERMVINDRAESVHRALGHLPLIRRMVCCLHYLFGAEHKEISDGLGMAVKTVAKHIQLGNQDLRIALKHHAPASKRKEQP